MTTLTGLDLRAALHTAETIARQAGAILRQVYEAPRHTDHKSIAIDLVTEADRRSEAFVVEALRAAYPDHHIHGEEGGGYGPTLSEACCQWFVDPLDGTTNFAHRMPHFAVTLALSDRAARPLAGVIYDPMRDECFKAVRGGGATLNGRPLSVSPITDLAQALGVTGFAYDSWTNPTNNIDHMTHFISRTHGVRQSGSAALDLAYVAAGRYELYWERGCKPWDTQAGILCLLEAGGAVSDYHGDRTSDDPYYGRYVLATNGHIHDQAVAVLTQGDAAPRPVL